MEGGKDGGVERNRKRERETKCEHGAAVCTKEND